MSLFELFGLAVGLGLDAFAVATGAGVVLQRVHFRHYFRLAWHFGLFQALMPVVGWLGGRQVARSIAAWDHWLAFGLLALVGAKMLCGGGDAPRRARTDPTRGINLVVLSVATSIDALAVGFSLAVLGVTIVQPACVIGLVALVMTALGLNLGKRLGKAVGMWAEVLGGLVLIALGVKILLEHVL